MATFAEDIEECAGEPIYYVVISPERRKYKEYDYEDETRPIRPPWTWAEARQSLNYYYKNGGGHGDVERSGQDCHSIYAWSANWIVFVSEYDGITDLERIPRNPTDCSPVSI